VEERIAALRSSGAGPAVELTQRQSRALAGKWYRTMEQRFGDNPGDELGWEIGLEDLYPQETEESYRATQRGNSEPYEGPWRITPMLAREMQWLLDMEDMRITPSASDRLLQDMADLYIAFSHLMIRRCRGDYGADSLVDTLPEWEAATPARGVSVTSGPKIMSLFDGYVAERGPAEATVKAWKRMIQHLVAFLGHDDAVLVTADDIIRWKDRLLSEPTKAGKQRSAKTVRETYLAAAKAVFGWAKENRKVDVDPTPGITVRGSKRQRLRDPGFTNEEALTILRATLEPPSGRLSTPHAAARRWVPWLCA